MAAKVSRLALLLLLACGYVGCAGAASRGSRRSRGSNAATVVLDADTPWVLAGTTTEGGGLDPAISLALRDLRRDWYSVFGIQPLVLNHWARRQGSREGSRFF
jgi:hypothetical protein